ncbi:hypothetical protein [Flagellimonas oceanensis]|uniref:hypothetical protein n=1 Tax=Flagellimonas oceanensis TaxID=2499163 RepID=UPI000F8CAE3E|nr:hypothetical protein [Allomuricauda oceanensis]
MKKSSFKSDEILGRNQLKSIFGGYEDDCKEGTVKCSCDNPDGSVTVGCSSTGNCDNFCD